ncbi:uncharacterized protein y4mH-like [Mercenaria mercenaria]|uniref:uncharacterized protein y4mH-like n=1 Tax=Mercenaria mercenaria TaxID=6596 RepID=UPI00234F9E64|nr:uncharacterized protein y4mH-like [Mercenaria mercenaria]
MEFVDTHFHVWALQKFSYPWPTPDRKIYKDYYPCGLENAVEGTPVKHAIFVQCLNGSVEEAEWVMDMATRHSIIKGVVAGLDITSPKLEEVIQTLKPKGLLKGVRHILDMEKDDWIARDDVSQGLDILGKHDISYDVLVRPHHLKYIPDVVSKHQNTKFIINHIAKPPVMTGKLDGWKEDMAEIAKSPNVSCKISGLISEQQPETWKQIDFQPFIDHVLTIFGPDRCIFGSDWPVFEMADATYTENLSLIRKFTVEVRRSAPEKNIPRKCDKIL